MSVVAWDSFLFGFLLGGCAWVGALYWYLVLRERDESSSRLCLVLFGDAVRKAAQFVQSPSGSTSSASASAPGSASASKHSLASYSCYSSNTLSSPGLSSSTNATPPVSSSAQAPEQPSSSTPSAESDVASIPSVLPQQQRVILEGFLEIKTLAKMYARRWFTLGPASVLRFYKTRSVSPPTLSLLPSSLTLLSTAEQSTRPKGCHRHRRLNPCSQRGEELELRTLKLHKSHFGTRT